VKKPANQKTRSQEALWALTRGQRLRYGAAIGAMAVGIVTIFGAPLISRWAIDALLAEPAALEPAWLARSGAAVGIDSSLARILWAAAAGILGLTTIGGAFHYLRGRWAAIASEAITRDLRDRLYHHLEKLPCRYHDGADTGDLVQRCTSDVETVRMFLSTQVVEIGRAAILLISLAPILLLLDVPMTAVSLGLFPFIIAFTVIFFRKIKARFLEMDEAEGAMTTVLQENLTGIRVVRAFARQEFERTRFAEMNERFRDRSRRLIDLLGVYWPISDLLCFAQIGLVLFFGAHWTATGRLTIGDLQAFLMYEAMVIWPVRHLGRVLAETGKAIVALGRIGEILAVTEEVGPSSAPTDAPVGLRGQVEFDRVHFAYREGEEVLADISFCVRPGETLALLGPPGSGKTAIVNLLLRLYDFERGSIRLDGMELSSLPRDYVRAQIGVVLQEPFLFSKTLRANVEIGRSGAGEEEIVHATTSACVHDTIAAFDQGYDTLIGERGVTLSGGQRQRITLARALLKDPPILILDDALSAVDTGTEAEILAALETRHGSRTTIVITHRLSSAVGADRILVMEEGRIVQEGAHRELVGSDGPYRRLWRIQGAMENELEETVRRRRSPEGER
jgi:ATP-binding cassette, subfamily B, bacterial